MIVNFKDRIAAGSSKYGPWQRRAGRPKTNNDCTTANEFVEKIDASRKEGLATNTVCRFQERPHILHYQGKLRIPSLFPSFR